MSTKTLRGQVKGDKTRVYRYVEVKRRNSSDGLFEDEWFDISDKVVKFGNVSKQIDPQKPNKIVFAGTRIVVDNGDGDFNREVDDSSIWSGYLTPQRTLVKISAGFLHQTLGADKIWTNTEIGNQATSWDEGFLYDIVTSTYDLVSDSLFYGIIQGDINLTDKNEVALPVVPLLQIFRDFPAANILGYNTSITASGFMNLIRDQTDGAGGFVFRPFFDDTTSNWSIQSTTSIYPALSTSTGEDVRDATVFDVMERLAEAENFVVFVDNAGRFRFQSRDATATTAWEFYGKGFANNEYGHTIKNISSLPEKHSRYYSRVRIKYKSEDTTTSYYVKEAAFSVNPLSLGWQYGYRTLDVDNIWIQTGTTAQVIGDALFTDLSSRKREIEYVTTFIPHLDVLDRVTISYASGDAPNTENLWDIANWSPATDTELFWDEISGDPIGLDGVEFKLFSVEMDLDRLECKFTAREV